MRLKMIDESKVKVHLFYESELSDVVHTHKLPRVRELVTSLLVTQSHQHHAV